MPGIVVAGDVSVDWYRLPRPAEGAAQHNWRLRPGSEMLVRPGGALLLAEMVKAALGGKAAVASQHLRGLSSLSPDRAIRSYAELGEFPQTNDSGNEKSKVYRVAQALGFQGPAEGQPPCPPVKDDDPKASLVILDDAGNGFRDTPEAWPRALEKKPLIICKTCPPLAQGKLWEHLTGQHRQRLVVVVNVDDLRLEGVNISRRLSWDRTALDFAWQVRYHETLQSLTQCAHLIVRIGLDGAILCSLVKGQPRLSLYFDPQGLEDSFGDAHPGRVLGSANAFVAALAAEVQRQGLEGVRTGIRYGLQASRRHLLLGMGKAGSPPKMPLTEIFSGEIDPGNFSSVEPPPVPDGAEGGESRETLERWSIIQAADGPVLEDLATEIVIHGAQKALRNAPVGSFGALKTVDKSEIESFQSIRNLMSEYLKNQAANRPLCIAVFGPPGSGKSFGVKEVAKSLADKRIETVTFNVAQFVSMRDLASAFHQVRDLAIQGKVPLTFFDEFDSNLETQALGWLKYFLAPMQDGEFKEGDSTHHVGKAIFVFAGGTAKSLEEFCQGPGDETQRAGKFKGAKGPDFVSRLRGYVNIFGTNPKGDGDDLYMVRRALLLRSLLERKARHLIDTDGSCSIDHGVLDAFLKINGYMHGARSMEALLDMSMLNKRKVYEPAALPSRQQMGLHVDADNFMNLVLQKLNWNAWLETLARAVQERYRKDQKGRKPPDDPAMQPWEKLMDDFKNSNRDQARHIPVKLKKIGYGLRPARKPYTMLKMSPLEKEVLAEMEHERWNRERLREGWRYGQVRNPDKKTNPCLVPWDELPENIRKYDREAVEGIPDLLKMAGFEAYPLK